MKHFDVTKAPLAGIHLVEANAGTGKTFNISSLVVRLIAEGALDLRNILVLTFTEAATAELRARIQSRCKEVLELFEAENTVQTHKKVTSDSFLAYCKGSYELDLEAQKRLQIAVTTFDEANISTIHGFCQTLLRSYPFEFNVRPNFELVPNPTLFVLDSIRELWRAFYAPSKQPMIQRMQQLFSELGKGMKSPEIVYDTFKRAFRTEHDIHPTHSLWDSYVRECDGKIQLNSLADFLEIAEKSEKAKSDYDEADWYAQLQHIITLYWVSQIRAYIHNEKEDKGWLDYDDLIHIVSKGIQEADEDFVQLIREEYKVALIDEFQDTDRDQFEIFKRLYTNFGTLYLIGDPKQAIYGFREADIHTYLVARNWVPRTNRYKLSYNYRSNPELLNFTNELFSSTQAKNPFLIDIDYQDSLHPSQKSTLGQEIDHQEVSPESLYSNHVYIERNAEWLRLHPIQMVEINGEGVTDTNEAIKLDVVARIKELLDGNLIRTINSSGQLDIEHFKASDIAVLVHKNHDALDIQRQLKSLGIESIINSQQSIFTTEEAQYLLQWLQVIQDPSKERLINTILAHRLSVLNSVELQGVQTQETEWARVMEKIHKAHSSLSKQKIHTILHTLFRKLGIWSRWTKLDNFERIITNIEHLFEIINRLQHTKWMGVSSLINYLHAQSAIDEDESALDEDVIRLNTDEDMVHIITAHRSKGLQYPIVFCPYSSSGSNFELNNKITKYRKDDQQMIDLRMVSKAKDIHLETALPMVIEEIASNIRLCYVSITRSESVCFMYTHTGARGWSSGLLSSQMDKSELTESISEKLVKPRTKNLKVDRLAKQTAHQFMEKFTANKAIYAEQINKSDPWYQKFKQQYELRMSESAEPSQKLQFATFEQDELLKNFVQVHSYSSIKRLKDRLVDGSNAHIFASLDDAKDYLDTDEMIVEQEKGLDGALENTENKSESMNALTRMPGGTELGSFYHRIMEELLNKWSIQAFDYKEWVLLEAKNFGLNEPQQYQFYHWVHRMMNVPLFDDVTISGLKKGQFIIEKPFFLSVKPYQVDFLYKLIRSNDLSSNLEIGAQNGQQNDIKKGLLANLEHSNNSISAGFLKGFIDLSFEHNDRYYILDYKTNYLQGNEAYIADSLNKHMVRLSYDIQGHLYSLAMHKFLAAFKKNYAYQEHFGGYFYVFVRGLSADNRRQGVHFCRPSEQRMKDMEVIVNGNY